MTDHQHTSDLPSSDQHRPNQHADVVQPSSSSFNLKEQMQNGDLPQRAVDLSLVLCHCCGVLNSIPTITQDEGKQPKGRCQRCYSPLHLRKTNSLERTLAFLIAASVLYIPANVLPMTVTESLLGRQQDTIMSGVIYFWQSGDYFVSTVIFMASIFIPLLKLVILSVLLTAVHLQSSKRVTFSPEHCAIMYRIVEFVGRWSMIDVFVVAMLAALIQIQSLATILAGTGAVAFGAVVVLTMFASLSFDPRIIWDNYCKAQQDIQGEKPDPNQDPNPLLTSEATNVGQDDVHQNEPQQNRLHQDRLHQHHLDSQVHQNTQAFESLQILDANQNLQMHLFKQNTDGQHVYTKDVQLQDSQQYHPSRISQNNDSDDEKLLHGHSSPKTAEKKISVFARLTWEFLDLNALNTQHLNFNYLNKEQ